LVTIEELERLAAVMCKIEIDWGHPDTVATIWHSVRPKVRQEFLGKAQYVIQELAKDWTLDADSQK
jgi:hypothetical protein